MNFKDLYIVTGKGGVGKTLSALALTKSLEESTKNKNVYYFSFEQNPNKELISKLGIKTIELTHLSSVESYISRKLNSKTIAKWVVSTSFFNALFDMVPSFGQLIFLGHVIDMAKDEENIIVIDAPASGHLLSTIHSPRTFKDIFKVGPVANDIDKMHNFLTDSKNTQCVVLSIPTELAIEEGSELQNELTNNYSINTIKILNSDFELSFKEQTKLPPFLERKIDSQKSLINKHDITYDFTIPFIVEKTPLELINKIKTSFDNNLKFFKDKGN